MSFIPRSQTFRYVVLSILAISLWIRFRRSPPRDIELLEYFESAESTTPLGSVPISALHERELWHRGVRLLVFDRRDGAAAARVLTLRRTAELVTCPAAWTLVGEHRRPCESVLEACLRGAREELGAPAGASAAELGLRALPGKRFQTIVRIVRGDNTCAGYGAARGERTVLDVCALEYDGSWPLRFDEEVQDTRWLTPEALVSETATQPQNFCCDDLARTFAPSVIAAIEANSPSRQWRQDRR